jgi:hypothetical protein
MKTDRNRPAFRGRIVQKTLSNPRASSHRYSTPQSTSKNKPTARVRAIRKALALQESGTALP